MAYRNIFISSSAKLSMKNDQLVINSQEEFSIPLENISTILIENQQVTLTSALLSRCTHYGILVYVCNNKHLPCGVFTSYNTHNRKLKIFKAQFSASEPFKKQLWKDIVIQKIQNQAAVLKNNGSVRLMVVTEKQYQDMHILVGELSSSEKPFQVEQLTFI